MPIKFRCYQCKKLLATKEGSEGKTFACPGCNTGLVVPGDAPEEVELPAPVVAVREDAPRSIARSMPPEPWYYLLLACWAWLWVIAGVAQFAYVASMVGGITHMGRENLDVGVRMLAASGILLMVALLVNAWSLMAIDAARNLRAMRYGQ